jgi:hypothetical protein
MEVLVVEPAKLRNCVWQQRLSLKDKEVKNTGYSTMGIPIPLSKVREIAHYTTILNREIVTHIPQM